MSESKGYKLAGELIDGIAEQWGLTAKNVREAKKTPTHVKCRREIAKVLFSMEFSSEEIAELLNRDGSTIRSYLNGK